MLRRVAEALNMPVEKFFSKEQSQIRCASTDECQRLWAELTTEEGRRYALQALQNIVELEQQNQSGA